MTLRWTLPLILLLTACGKKGPPVAPDGSSRPQPIWELPEEDDNDKNSHETKGDEREKP